MEELEKWVEAEAWGRKWGMPPQGPSQGPSWGCWRLKQAEMRGQMRGSLWSQYQQEHSQVLSITSASSQGPGLTCWDSSHAFGWGQRNYLIYQGLSVVSALSLVFHSTGSSDFLVPGCGLTPLMTHFIWLLKLLSSWSLIMKPKFSQHWGGPVSPKLWVLGFRKNQDLAGITQRSSNMRKNGADN